MDLNTITEVRRPASADAVTKWENGFAWLAGGTWLFSEPQINTHTLIDLETLKWPSLKASKDGLEIAATCRVVELDQFVEKAPSDWTAAPVFRMCCRSFLASFKIWNEATVGGNICMSLPAGPMISLTTALEGVCTLWPRSGKPREVPMIEFVTGNHANVLAPGEVLLIGTRCPEQGTFLLTITAATLQPVQLRFKSVPSSKEVKDATDKAVPFDFYLDDTHGSPAHRR